MNASELRRHEEHCIFRCGYNPLDSRHPEREGEETAFPVTEHRFTIYQMCSACGKEVVRAWSPAGPVCMECGVRLAG